MYSINATVKRRLEIHFWMTVSVTFPFAGASRIKGKSMLRRAPLSSTNVDLGWPQHRHIDTELGRVFTKTLFAWVCVEV